MCPFWDLFLSFTILKSVVVYLVGLWRSSLNFPLSTVFLAAKAESGNATSGTGCR